MSDAYRRLFENAPFLSFVYERNRIFHYQVAVFPQHGEIGVAIRPTPPVYGK